MRLAAGAGFLSGVYSHAAMQSLYIAILVVAALILLYYIPATRGLISKVAPWVALLGGGLVAGALLMAPDSARVVGGSGDDDDIEDINDVSDDDRDDDSDIEDIDFFDIEVKVSAADNDDAVLGDYIVDTSGK